MHLCLPSGEAVRVEGECELPLLSLLPLSLLLLLANNLGTRSAMKSSEMTSFMNICSRLLALVNTLKVKA